MISILYAVWCGLCWRLRGGALNQLTSMVGIHVGTGITRIVTSALITAPLLHIDWKLAVLWPFIFAAMTLPYFDRSMGLEAKADYGWLAMWGAAVTSIVLLPAIYMDPDKVWLVCGGPLLMLPYALAKPLGGKWTERAECGVGFLLGLLMWAAYHG